MTRNNVTIREQRRLNSGPQQGLKQEWFEWQVWQSRKIIHRADFEVAAREWCANNGYVVDSVRRLAK